VVTAEMIASMSIRITTTMSIQRHMGSAADSRLNVACVDWHIAAVCNMRAL